MNDKTERRMCRACGNEAQPEASKLNCPCDLFVHPPTLKIAAGMDTIPRQTAMFAEFRRAMLAALSAKPALAGWRARNSEDYGVMLLEMWAYICDVLAFYDETIAHESYLRTARLRPSLRKLVALLGYVPRPAVAAMVELALLAEGRQPVSLPAGTAFRSGAFQGGIPQVFELEKAITIHPFCNQWSLEAPRPTTLGKPNPNTLDVLLARVVTPGTPVLIRISDEQVQAWKHQLSDRVVAKVGSIFGSVTTTTLMASNHGPEQAAALPIQVRIVESVRTETAIDGTQHAQLKLNNPVVLPQSTQLDSITLLTPTQKAGLWTQGSFHGLESGKPWLRLDNIYNQIKVNDYVLVQKGGEYRWFCVIDSGREKVEADAPIQVEINGNIFKVPTQIEINGTIVKIPSSLVSITKLTLDAGIDDPQHRATSDKWSEKDSKQITVHFGFVPVGHMFSVPRNTLAPGDALCVASVADVPPAKLQPDRFILQDNNQTGLALGGKLDFAKCELKPNSDTTLSLPLLLPVQLFGNIVVASRGETVRDEILGSGDGSQANQSFRLKKSPLTYTAASSGTGTHQLASSLCIYVNGIRWTEVENFFGQKEQAQVYIVRQNDDGESIVTFGDGKRGARLPTGKNNVIADYRYGAGRASPPAGLITQIAKPAKGLRAIKNPVAAYGGDDAEDAAGLRTYAPRSALLLGRAVSMKDMEAVAANVPGVRAVQSEWRWNGVRQQPVAQIWYIGPAELNKEIVKKLHGLCDPSTPIAAQPAVGMPARLALDIEVDERYLEAQVLDDVKSLLWALRTGLLRPEQLGIGRPLYRSYIFDAVSNTSGVISVSFISWNDMPFTEFAKSPGAGCYFDLETGGFSLSSNRSANVRQTTR